MDRRLLPRRVVKRAALVAAANWPTVVMQATTDAVVKVVVVVPVVGGIVLAALVIGAEPRALLALEVREMAATVLALLTARPATWVAFVAAVTMSVVGGACVAFAVKAGTVATVVRAESEAGPVEESPLHLMTLSAVSRFSVEGFIDAVRRYGFRFVGLGCVLLGTYAVSGGVYVRFLLGAGAGPLWLSAAAGTAALVAWVTAVNLLYLLAQVIMVADDCGVGEACRRLVGLLVRAWMPVLRIFVFVLAIVAGSTVASVLATAALGLVGFVPLVWFAVLPLQLIAWLMRALVSQYIGLGAVAAYAAVYREVSAPTGAGVREASSVPAAPGTA